MGLTTPSSVQPGDTGSCGGDGFPHAPGVTIDLVVTAPTPPGDPTVYIRRAATYLASLKFTDVKADIPTRATSLQSELPAVKVSAAEPGTNFAISIALIEAYHTIQFNVSSACVHPVGTDDPSNMPLTGASQ